MQIGRAVVLSGLILQFVPAAVFPRADKQHQVSLVACAQGVSVRIPLRSTDRLPEASGTARVEREGGTTEVEVELDSIKPASLFGGDYNTYVLWVVPPAGRAENLGEFALDGRRSKLRAATRATAFAIVVTAEPHYLVSAPSAFVVMETPFKSESRTVGLPLVQGVYNFERSTLANLKSARGQVHSEVRQAFTAVRLAQRAGASDLAGDELAEAQRALNATLNLWHQRKDRTEIAAQARETVRLAVAAQRLAQDRAFQGARVEEEGSGGGKGETGRRDPRGNDWR
jgi:hypothetical protein